MQSTQITRSLLIALTMVVLASPLAAHARGGRGNAPHGKALAGRASTKDKYITDRTAVRAAKQALGAPRFWTIKLGEPAADRSFTAFHAHGGVQSGVIDTRIKRNTVGSRAVVNNPLGQGQGFRWIGRSKSGSR